MGVVSRKKNGRMVLIGVRFGLGWGGERGREGVGGLERKGGRKVIKDRQASHLLAGHLMQPTRPCRGRGRAWPPCARPYTYTHMMQI